MRYRIDSNHRGLFYVLDDLRIISAGHPTEESARQWAEAFGDEPIETGRRRTWTKKPQTRDE